MISPLGERIKYFPKPVGPCAEATFALNVGHEQGM
jgi:hypothetical protein